MSPCHKSTKIRLFLTCWLIFVVHFATDFVREHYLVLSITEDHSFKLDKYMGLNPDIFMTDDHGAHHGANPGASMIAAIPYFVFKPLVNWIDNLYSNRSRESNKEMTAIYKDYRAPRVKFYKKVRERGWDIKFGLVSLITMVFCMAPLSALSAVFMYHLLSKLGYSTRWPIWLALLYALGTPIFFRTGYLNQNVMVGIFGFIGFVQLWEMGERKEEKNTKRYVFAGFLGGLTLLCDYSGLVPLIMLYGYGLLRRMDTVPIQQAIRESFWYLAGAIGPIMLLGFYQWQSFGNPFYPGQHYMPPVPWIDIGYRGVGLFSKELLWMLLFDLRFGLFVISPILLLAFIAPFLNYLKKSIVPFRETLFIIFFFVTLSLLFSGIQYTRLQWVTGIRYMVPVIPFLFILTSVVLIRMPRFISYGLILISFGGSWAISMVRRGVGVPEESMLASVWSVLFEGLQLPWLTTVSKMASQYMPFLEGEAKSPLPLFVILSLIIYGIWNIQFSWKIRRREKVHISDQKETVGKHVGE